MCHVGPLSWHKTTYYTILFCHSDNSKLLIILYHQNVCENLLGCATWYHDGLVTSVCLKATLSKACYHVIMCDIQCGHKTTTEKCSTTDLHRFNPGVYTRRLPGKLPPEDIFFQCATANTTHIHISAYFLSIVNIDIMLIFIRVFRNNLQVCKDALCLSHHTYFVF